MKNYLILFTLLFSQIVFSQEQEEQEDDFVENSMGILFIASPFSNDYSFGLGATGAEDFSSNGEGFGLIGNFYYLLPKKDISSYIDYTYGIDLLLKYDFSLGTPKLQVAPTAGLGYHSTHIKNSSKTEGKFYFLGGANLSFFISNSVILGADVNKYFITGSSISASLGLKFQL